jgi:hypothetical protein
LGGASGTNQHRLLPGGNPVATGNLSWSPDGTKIVYEAANGGFLSIMNADGTGSTSLVANAGAKYPSWVPVASASSVPPPAIGGGGTGAGSGTPMPAPPASVPAKKPLVCKKGFKKKTGKGKQRCVRKHKAHKHKPKH